MVNDNESPPTDDIQPPFDEADTMQVELPVPVDIEAPVERVERVERAVTPPLNDSIEVTSDNYEKKSSPSSPSSATELASSFEKDSVASVEAQRGVMQDSKTLKKKCCARKNLIFASFIGLLFVGAALGIVFGTGVAGGGSSGSPAASMGSQENPPDDDSPPPTSSPTQDADTGTDMDTDTDYGTDTDPPVTDTSTDPPTDTLLAAIKSFSTNGLDDENSTQWRAYQWMANDDPITTADTDILRLKQRYALATLYVALADEMPAFATQEECAWPTAACGTQNATILFGAQDWQVTEINMARQSFTGTIPPEIELLAPSLVILDMAENPKLHGSIPEELYNLVNLKYLYLHHNAMTGTLSESFSKTQLLEEIYLGNNAFTGPIPDSLGSRQDTRRPLRYLILHSNQMTGSIPEGMALSHAFYVDLSFNKFAGTLPQDIGQDFVKLRHLYLDHNEFTGPIPESYALAGDGRIYDLYLSDNMLTGGVPSGWVMGNVALNTVTVQNNSLTVEIDMNLCKLSVLEGGELVELSADCEICYCKTLCDQCWI